VDKDKRMHYSRGHSARKIHCNGEEKGGEGKEQLAVDVESLQLNIVRDRSNSHSPLANPEYDNSNCDSSPNDRRSESDSGDDSNDVPWDSLVIAEPDIQVLPASHHMALHKTAPLEGNNDVIPLLYC
jgi:hypothetical protein